MAITNAQLAQQIADLVEARQNIDKQFQEWITGVAGGGVSNDGRYPLTDYFGNSRYTLSPDQLEENVQGSVDSASSYAVAALASQNAASASADAASTDEGLADAHRIAALNAQALAETARDTSVNASVNATASQIAAALSETNASASEIAAGLSEDAALVSELAAAASAAAAATFDPDLFFELSTDNLIDNDTNLLFKNAAGANDGTTLYRAAGNAMWFKYTGNSFTFQSLDNSLFRVRSQNSTDGFIYDPAAQSLAILGAVTGSNLNVSNWDTAFGWGNHAGLYETLDATIVRTGDAAWNATNWDTAHGWGDHALGGYLTSFTEADPTVPANVKAITGTQIGNWDTAFGWGDHSTENYAVTTGDTFTGLLGADAGVLADDVGLPKIRAGDGAGNLTYIDYAGLYGNRGSMYLQNSNASGSLYIRANGTFNFQSTAGAVRATINASGDIAATGAVTGANLNVSNWDTAFGWGDHASGGYAASSHSHDATDLTSGILPAARIIAPPTGHTVRNGVAQFQRPGSVQDWDNFKVSGAYGVYSTGGANQPTGGLSSYPTVWVGQNSSDVGTQLAVPRVASQPIAYRGWSGGGTFTAWHYVGWAPTLADADLSLYAKTSTLSIANWNTAFGWGDQAATVALIRSDSKSVVHRYDHERWHVHDWRYGDSVQHSSWSHRAWSEERNVGTHLH